MRANRAAAVAVTAGLALSGLAGCGATTQSATGSTTSASATTAAPSSTLPLTGATLAVTPTTIQPPGHVGDTVQVPAAGQNPPAQVTLVKVVDPAQGADRFSQPVSGGRFVGVQLRITLGGTAPQFLDVNSDTVLADANGNLYQPIDANLVSSPHSIWGPPCRRARRCSGASPSKWGSTASQRDHLHAGRTVRQRVRRLGGP